MIETRDADVILDIAVTPRASRTCISGTHDARLKVMVTAAPTDGKANQAIVALLAKTLRVAKSNVAIHSGHQSRYKRVRVCGVDPATVKEKLCV